MNPKILVVDDNQAKCKKVIDQLVGLGVEEDNISICYVASDARKFLREHTVDLLILDLLIPNKVGDDESLSTALEFLKDIAEDDKFHKPKHIVGLTAHEDAYNDAIEEFRAYTWVVINFNNSNDEWRTSLENCVKYINRIQQEVAPKSYDFDLCVITALRKPEMAAVMRLEWNWQAAEPLDDVGFFQRGSFEIDGRSIKVASICIGGMGMVSAALVAAKVIERLRPKLLAMCGICAGMKGTINKGDVIVADPCWDWQSGKKTVDPTKGNARFLIDGDREPLAEVLRTRFEQLSDDTATLGAIRQNYNAHPDTVLAVRPGPLASGSAVLADGTTISEIKEQHRGLLGVEMESYGVYLAAKVASEPRPLVFSAKSVCDFADAEKDDLAQPYAAYTSAEVLKAFMTKYGTELLEKMK